MKTIFEWPKQNATKNKYFSPNNMFIAYDPSSKLPVLYYMYNRKGIPRSIIEFPNLDIEDPVTNADMRKRLVALGIQPGEMAKAVRDTVDRGAIVHNNLLESVKVDPCAVWYGEGHYHINRFDPANYRGRPDWWNDDIPSFDDQSEKLWMHFNDHLETIYGSWGAQMYLDYLLIKKRYMDRPLVFILVLDGEEGTGKSFTANVWALVATGGTGTYCNLSGSMPEVNSHFTNKNAQHVVIVVHEARTLNQRALSALKDEASSEHLERENKNQDRSVRWNGTTYVAGVNDGYRPFIDPYARSRRWLVILARDEGIEKSVDMADVPNYYGEAESMPTPQLIDAIDIGIRKRYFEEGEDQLVHKLRERHRRSKFVERCDPDLVEIYRDEFLNSKMAGSRVTTRDTSMVVELLPYLEACLEKWNSMTEKERNIALIGSDMGKLVTQMCIFFPAKAFWKLLTLIHEPLSLSDHTHFMMVRKMLIPKMKIKGSANGKMPYIGGGVSELLQYIINAFPKNKEE